MPPSNSVVPHFLLRLLPFCPPKLFVSSSCPQSPFTEGRKQQLPANSAQVPQESMWKSTHGKLPETLEDEGHQILPDARSRQPDSILTTELGVGDIQSVSQILLTCLLSKTKQKHQKDGHTAALRRPERTGTNWCPVDFTWFC